MSPRPLGRRIEILEENVEGLSQLPLRVSAVETELASFRAEVRAEFATLRNEIHEGDEETRRQMRVLHEDLIARIALLQEGVDRANGTAKRKNRRHR